MPKLAPPSGDNLNGVFIPGGTNVGTNPWYVMRDPVNFGPDGSLFIPEGWINIDEERRKEKEYVGNWFGGMESINASDRESHWRS
jgi:hypothetical protein